MQAGIRAVDRMKRAILALVGLGLAGYGALLLVGLIPHEAPLVGVLALLVGLPLAAVGLPRVKLRRGGAVAALGVVASLGVVAYNLARGSGLGVPEWAILVYGVALVGASRRLERRLGRFEVGTLVAWSFPLVLAPLTLFALNAAVSAGSAGNAASPIVHALVVQPTAAVLALMGTGAEVVGNNLVLGTPRGRLVLGVGLVCAGLYPMVLFAGLVALHAWIRRTPPKRTAAYLGVGLAGLWAMNLVRLVILVKVGERWGGATLQTVHAHIGWALFALFTVVFWAVVLRKVEGPESAVPAPVARR